MLNKAELNTAIKEQKLIEGYINLDKQLTPNGIDLTVGKLFKFCSLGSLDFSNSDRQLPQMEEVFPQKENPRDKFGWWQLSRGAYKVRTNEVINMPNNLCGLAFSRTSLLRMGAFTQNGVWDAGFSGKSEFILVVQNSFGIRLKENARVVQLVFFKVDETEGYNGIYNHIK
ncbi:MAG: deoxyuridine 5'-triphosphate nucleotidohydrolase [Candidatus Omnitrophota bacterium]|nr:deoxyuridine 5'-triphosphate nucleotidohydrolase [Candidatus Omnitrophota bacterium]